MLCGILAHGYEKKVLQLPGKPATPHTGQKKVFYSPELAVSSATLTNPLVLFVLTYLYLELSGIIQRNWYFSGIVCLVIFGINLRTGSPR